MKYTQCVLHMDRLSVTVQMGQPRPALRELVNSALLSI